jgi:dolichol-phosphate mannosyltransferase
MKIVIVIPTYDERENISELISKIQDQRAFLAQDLEVLVVDDESPDGTANVVYDLRTRDSKRRCFGRNGC